MAVGPGAGQDAMISGTTQIVGITLAHNEDVFVERRGSQCGGLLR